RIIEQEEDEQFQRTVLLYESLQPQRAQEMMATLIQDGDSDQVVAYLNAMQPRAAKKIIEKFPDPIVAADLLERLRTRGLQAAAPEEP
ncbi:MAG: hypothetical protein VYC34_10740, partial [Planctomycetota bacterium]|nr:hypothetical protein [Planctomycetota bacterium]